MTTTTGGEDGGTSFFVGKLHLGDTLALLQTGKPLVLEIAVGTGTPGSADDFVLKEIAARGAVFVLGW